MDRLSPAPRALNTLNDTFLGLRFASPQASCCHPLRGLGTLMPCVRSTDSQSQNRGLTPTSFTLGARKQNSVALLRFRRERRNRILSRRVDAAVGFFDDRPKLREIMYNDRLERLSPSIAAPPGRRPSFSHHRPVRRLLIRSANSKSSNSSPTLGLVRKRNSTCAPSTTTCGRTEMCRLRYCVGNI